MNNSRLIQHARVTAAMAMFVAVRGALGALGDAISYTAPNSVYTQNFNSLATYSNGTATWSNNSTPPVAIDPTLITLPTLSTSVGQPIDMTGPSADFFHTIDTISQMTAWQVVNWQGNSAPLKYTVSDGGTTSSLNALNAFYDPARQATGTPNNLSLGVQTASETGNVLFGVRLVNNSTVSLNAISVSFLGELFHQDINQKPLKFGYLVTSATNNSDIFTDIPPNGQAIIPNQVGGLTASFSTGAAANSTQSLSITNLPIATAWTPGQALWLTWEMDRGGGGQGVGIDDLTFSASQLTTFDTLTWNHGSGTWDTAAANWTGSTTVFANNYNASFGNIASNVVITVTSSGVTVTSLVTVGNSANTYTFAGGAINGANAALTIAGGGTVQLTAANGYGLATNINAGTLIVDNNNELGATAATLKFGGGNLRLLGDLAAGARPLNVLASGGKIDLNGHNATFGAASSAPVLIQGLLQVTGGGNLNLGVQPTIGSNGGTGGLSVAAGTTVTLQGFARGTATDIFVNSTINGVMILNSFGDIGGARFNFNSSGSTTVAGTGASASMTHSGMNGSSVISGTGEIQVPWGSKWIQPTTGGVQLSDGSSASSFVTGGVVISNTSGANGGNIGVNIHLNSLEGTPGHAAFVRRDVSSANAFNTNSTAGAAGDFVTIIGGTKNNGTGKGGIGPNFSEIVISGNIYGNSDISVGNDYKSGGSGNVILATQSHYHGVTMLNGGGTGTPVFYIGVNNALPTDTDLVFSSISGAGSPALDLNGFNQTVQSLSVWTGTNSPLACVISNSGPTPATLTISGAVTPYYSYSGQINDQGPTLTDVLGSNFIAYGGSATALVKDGPSTFVLGKYNDNGTSHHSFSTYSGGTTARGGILSIAFDGALGNATGSLTFDGGTVAIQAPDLLYNIEQSVTWNTARPLTVTANGGTVNTPTFTAFDNNSISHNLVASVVFSGAGGYNWAGNLSFTGAAGSSVTLSGGGPVAVSPGASISIAPTVAFTLDGADPVTDSANNTKHVNFINNGLLQITGASKSLGAVTGTGTLTQAGTGTTTLTSYQAGPLNVNAGKLAIAPTNAARHTSAVLLQASALSVAAGTTLDLTNHDMLIHSGSTPAIESKIGTAYYFGLWSFPGITSSSAQSNSITTLGIMSGTDYNTFSPTPGTFDGTPVANTDTVIKFTYVGDLNLDGKVNDDDLFIFNGAYFFGGTGNYALGDLNFDGRVNDDDLFLFNGNYFFPPASPLGSLGDTSPGATSAPGTSALVPEPTSLFLLGLGSAVLLARRKPRVPAGRRL